MLQCVEIGAVQEGCVIAVYSFVKDIQVLFCSVLGRKMNYAGEEI